MQFLTNLFKNLFSQDESLSCSAEQVLEKIKAAEKPVVIDVRHLSELQSTGVIPGAIHIPLGSLSSRIEEFRGKEEVICYCRSGNRSKTAASMFRKNDINGLSMNGGIMLWKRMAAPIEPWE